MPTRHHHRRVVVRGLLLAHGTHEDGVKAVRGRQRHLDGQLRGGGPGRAVARLDLVELLERGQGDGAGGGGGEERGRGRQREQRAELRREGAGRRRGRVRLARRREQRPVRRPPDVGHVRERPEQLPRLRRVAPRELREGAPRVGDGREGARVGECRREERDVLQAAEVELEIRPPRVEHVRVRARPGDRGGEVVVFAQLAQDRVHFGELLLERRRLEGIGREVRVPVDGVELVAWGGFGFVVVVNFHLGGRRTG